MYAYYVPDTILGWKAVWTKGKKYSTFMELTLPWKDTDTKQILKVCN